MYKKLFNVSCYVVSVIVLTPFVMKPALAANVIQTKGKTCSDVQTELANFQNALIYYPSKRNPNIILFDRFVSSAAFCPPRESGKNAFVTSSDKPACLVMQCQSPDGRPQAKKQSTKD